MRLDVEPEFLHADGADAPSTSPMHRRYFGDASAMRLGPPTPSAQPPSWRPRDSCPPPQGEAGEEASSPGSSESSRGVGLPVGGAGVGGGEHCDPVVVGHCALRETTTAGAGAGSAGACAVLCSVVVRPELRRTGASAASWSSAPRPRRAPAGSLSCTCGPWTAPRRCCASTSGLASSWRRPPEEQRGGGRLEALTAAVARPAQPMPRGAAWRGRAGARPQGPRRAQGPAGGGRAARGSRDRATVQRDLGGAFACGGRRRGRRPPASGGHRGRRSAAGHARRKKRPAPFAVASPL
ncbi:unnamed protein product [Prorocentrum cordatum]|uniref:Histone acetyltransferase n=1 Tax=Prorocentrum cordatum TaxID=2364126 RepID=A0ABN9X0C4_9DINO|nr:unnamed protein product [Polarella glacialis]